MQIVLNVQIDLGQDEYPCRQAVRSGHTDIRSMASDAGATYGAWIEERQQPVIRVIGWCGTDIDVRQLSHQPVDTSPVRKRRQAKDRGQQPGEATPSEQAAADKIKRARGEVSRQATERIVRGDHAIGGPRVSQQAPQPYRRQGRDEKQMLGAKEVRGEQQHYARTELLHDAHNFPDTCVRPDGTAAAGRGLAQ